jgi:hypothetical protein
MSIHLYCYRSSPHCWVMWCLKQVANGRQQLPARQQSSCTPAVCLQHPCVTVHNSSHQPESFSATHRLTLRMGNILPSAATGTCAHLVCRGCMASHLLHAFKLAQLPLRCPLPHCRARLSLQASLLVSTHTAFSKQQQQFCARRSDCLVWQ